MTDENHCKPEPRLRGRFGTHWVVRHDESRGDMTPIMVDWEIFNGQGRWAYSEICAELGWRYLAPVTPPATVAALVEALEAFSVAIPAVLDAADIDASDTVFTVRAVSPTGSRELAQRSLADMLEAARAALALYREAGR